MPKFTLTIELPDDYDTTPAAEDPDAVAHEVLRGVFHDCKLVDRAAALLPRGWRLDADTQPDFHLLADVREQAIVALVAVEAIDMSDHYPMPRKRAWGLRGPLPGDPTRHEDAPVTLTPYVDGGVAGVKAVHDDGRTEYVVLNPSGGSDDGSVSVFVYHGETGDPAQDAAYVHFDLFDSENIVQQT